MQYMRLSATDREQLLSDLEAMPHYLEESFAGLSQDVARRPGVGYSFSAVEQVWHLADLEQEGFGQRIERLMSEQEPELPDFDGTAIATARSYKTLSLEEGVMKFRQARLANVAALRVVNPASWTRGGTQVGVGKVSLCDIPSFMIQHDAAHKTEIEAWKKHIAQQTAQTDRA